MNSKSLEHSLVLSERFSSYVIEVWQHGAAFSYAIRDYDGEASDGITDSVAYETADDALQAAIARTVGFIRWDIRGKYDHAR